MSVMTDTATRTDAHSRSTAAMTELLDQLQALTDAARRPDLGARLAQARARVTDPRLRIVVTGQTGQGMSMLVESIIGAPVTAAVPAGLVVVSYSDSDFVRPIDADSPDAGTGPVPRVEIGTPHDLLAQGVVLIDTPGTSGMDSARASQRCPC